MLQDWLATPNIDVYAVLFILAFFTAIEVILGHYQNTKREKDDWIQETIGFFIVSGTKLLLFFAVVVIGDNLFPSGSNAFSEWSLWLSIPFYLLIDDLLQYWYHRSAHEYDWLWKHHRAHHAAEDMGIWVSYRNSWFYYLIMPNIWWAGICTWLGMAPAVIFGLIFKQLVVTASHSTWNWDKYLYKVSFLSPLTSVIERILITPAFHHAHHGKSQVDRISDPNGNFGNTFSLWDQMFGTAKFTRQFPEEYGLQTDPNDPWYAHVFYPIFKSPKTGSQIAPNYKRQKTAVNAPIEVELEPGTHLYCRCGYSQNQPFCDGTHHGTKFKPLIFEVKKKRKVRLCRCKQSGSAPFCDDSHLKYERRMTKYE